MYKITYKTSNLFSLKKYDYSNLNAQSYVYPTIYGIRCAILGAIIQTDGLEVAQDLFHNVKNAIIYIQYPNKYKVTGQKIKRYTNNSYLSKKQIDYSQKEKGEYFTQVDDFDSLNQMGYREFVDLKNIAFYIDKSIPNIEMYLKNIDWIGTAESMVYLHSIEETNKLENVMISWNENIDEYTYEQFDWDKKNKFENIYMYSDKRKHWHKKLITYIGELTI